MTTNTDTIRITLEDSEMAVPADQTYEHILETEGYDNAVGVKIGGETADLRTKPSDGETVEVLTFEDDEGKNIYWHTTAHILAQAVKMYFDDDASVKLGVGPPVEEGFYYDFDLPRTLSEDELEHIENIMRQIIKQDYSLERFYRDREEAIEELKQRSEDYKVELVEELDEKPSFYRQDGFEDLCRGPHLPSTGQVEAVKLTKLSGSYWKGDEDNADLQRIYGISFPSQRQLEQYEKRLEEAKKRDHRKLGRELDLFHIEDEVGPGLVVWHPNGSKIRNTIEQYARDAHTDRGYEFVDTPHLAREKLWDISGHLDYYSEDMFPALEMDDRNYRVKPMNCPFHMKIFNSQTRSYRDLPIRFAELGTVYRQEKSGVLHGLLRARGFTQDDAHVFCTEDQLEDELVAILDFNIDVLSTFGFDDYEIAVSTRPEKYVGTDDRWDLSTEALKDALDRSDLDYSICEGEGAFYGPKIEVRIRDSLNREWQCSTIQVDFNLPEQFDIEYVDESGEARRPIMIHRALFGSLERFFGILVEHYGGAFPAWLAPTPVCILPISEENLDYAETIKRDLEQRSIDVELTDPDETLGKRIQKSQSQKIPYTLIIGSDEEESGEVEVREYGEEDSYSATKEDFYESVEADVDNRRLIHETLEFEAI
ncbi:MAG: threonine--tRNA ligase [bacterium]